MEAAGIANAISRGKTVEDPASGQTFPLGLLLCAGSVVILTTIQQAAWSTVLLFVCVSFAGFALCKKTQIQLNDPALRILAYFWLIKLGLTLFILYGGWMPQLDPASSSAEWGYDPQRYYLQAQDLIDNHWSPDFLSLNYVGILYYYGAIFHVLGRNPVVPALINAFVTLVAGLYVVKTGYEIMGRKAPHAWILGSAVLLPELLWFDVMTSRETLVAALLVIALLTAGRYFARTAPISGIKTLIVVGLSALVICAVRVSVLLPVCVAVLLMALVFLPKRGSHVAPRMVLIAVAAALALSVVPALTTSLGGYDLDLASLARTTISGADNVAGGADVEWSDRSIGTLLIPSGLMQAFMFLPPRMILYLVAPLPSLLVSVRGLLGGSWIAWQSLLDSLSSVLNVIVFPYALASLVQSIKTRKTNPAPLIFHIPYWVTFMAIAGGNLIIHERYRVLASMLLWACAWLGKTTCTKSLVSRTSVVWYGLLAMGALFYLSYKVFRA